MESGRRFYVFCVEEEGGDSGGRAKDTKARTPVLVFFMVQDA